MKHLNTIHWLASRMDDLLKPLLEYSRLARADQRVTSVSLDDVVDGDIEEILGARFAEGDVPRRPVRLGPFPVTASGCRKCWSIWSATLSSTPRPTPPRWVEVGSEDAVPPDAEQPLRAFHVRDNGIGSAPSSRKTSSGPPGALG